MKTLSTLLIVILVFAASPSLLAKMATRRPIHVAPRTPKAQPVSRTANPPPPAAANSAPANPAAVQPLTNPSFLAGSSEMTNQIPIIIPETSRPQSTNRVTTKIAEPLPPEQKPVIVAHYDSFDPILQFQMQNAHKGDPRSQYALGMRYLEGIGVERNEFLAREYLEKSSAQGDRRAAARLKEIP